MHRHHETTVERLGARKKSHRRKDWPSRGCHVARGHSAIRGPWSEQPGVGGTVQEIVRVFSPSSVPLSTPLVLVFVLVFVELVRS